MKQSGKIMPSVMATELLLFLPDGAGAGVGGEGDDGRKVGFFDGGFVGSVQFLPQAEAEGYFPFALKRSLQLYALGFFVNWQS
jgi:hypothetical protein